MKVIYKYVSVILETFNVKGLNFHGTLLSVKSIEANTLGLVWGRQ